MALPIALIVAVVTEMLMGGYGLGGAMMTSSRFADSRGVFAGIVEIAVVGYVLVKGMALVRRRLLLWHQEALRRAPFNHKPEPAKSRTWANGPGLGPGLDEIAEQFLRARRRLAALAGVPAPADERVVRHVLDDRASPCRRCAPGP